MSRVLVCSSDPALAKQLQSIAEQVGLAVYRVAQVAPALKLMAAHRPELVLLDDQFGSSRALDVASDLLDLNKEARIVLLLHHGQFELSRLALRIGITDLVMVPSELHRLGDLLMRLSHSVTAQVSHAEGRSIAFFSAKGGTGCTTLALNTAIALTTVLPLPVLLIDGHTHSADVSSMLDVRSPRSAVDLLPVLDELTPGHIRDVGASHESGLHLLLAPSDPDVGDDLLPEHLARIVRVARRSFGAVVIDCPPLLFEECQALLEVSGTPVLVSTPDTPSVITWRRLKHFAAECLPRARVVANQVTPQSEITPRDLADLLGLPLAGEVRQDIATLMPLANTGKSLFDAPTGKRRNGRPPGIVQDIVRIARAVLG